MRNREAAPRLRPVRRRSINTVVQDRDLVQRRREQIFRAATRVFISRGYHEATVREIAEEAGLSLGSLYSYIRTKEDILYLVFERLTSVLREDIQLAMAGITDPVKQIQAALRANLATIWRYQDEVLLMYQETKSLDQNSLHHVLAAEAGYVKFFEDILESGYRHGLFKGEPRLSADIITYLCALVALRRWNLRRRFAVDVTTDGLIAFIMRGLGISTRADGEDRQR
jgi:AcrR family transcriptional regulator